MGRKKVLTMPYTQKEILEALELIKKVCWEHTTHKDNCEQCPFYSVSGCGCLFNSGNMNPHEWELNSPDRTWHAVF